MTVIQPLNMPPIREAIIDFRVTQLPDCDLEKLRSLPPVMQEKYPQAEKIHQRTLRFIVEDGEEKTEREHQILGYRHISSDGKNYLQFKKDGLTLSQLEPYQGWDDFSDKAKEAWNAYKGLFNLDERDVGRIATRYINILRLPLPVNFEKYLVTPPEVPESLPQEISQFLSKIAIRFDEDLHNAIVTQGLESTEQSYANIVLDIDVFYEERVTAIDIWEKLNMLRDTKNRIFFASITEKTKGMFK